jgi:hypothetical protein
MAAKKTSPSLSDAMFGGGGEGPEDTGSDMEAVDKAAVQALMDAIKSNDVDAAYQALVDLGLPLGGGMGGA